MNTQTIKGNWNVAKGKLKQKYSQLTDDDLRYAEGSEQELLGRLQKKTGQSREQLERFLSAECGCDFSGSASSSQGTQGQSQNPRPWETSSPRSGSESRAPGSESRNQPESDSRNQQGGQRGGSGQSGSGTPPPSNREQR